MNYKVENAINEALDRLDITEKYQLLKESSFAKIMKEYFEFGFIIVTADRSCEAEKGSKCNDIEFHKQRRTNKENEKKIRDLIRASKFGFIPTYGGYREEIDDGQGGKKLSEVPSLEKSFIIPSIQIASIRRRKDYEKLFELGIDLAKKFNQDSFLFKPPNEIDKNAYFIDKNGNKETTFEDIEINNLDRIYFTRLRKSNPNRRFSMTENVVYIPKSPIDLSEARKRYGEVFFGKGWS